MLAARGVLAMLWIAATLGLVALGTWQVERRAWKSDLIARVEARLRASPVPAPVAAGRGDAYRRVVVSGRFLADSDTFVQASTVRGPGWWVLTPLRTATGRTILINRGYVADRRSPPASSCSRDGGAACVVTGLLRLTEPGGGFLRGNDPPADRWYSRDVAAIAARRGLAMAPYFIDADAGGNAPGQPVGGLTVVHFPDNHLVYAITWYILAMMTAAGFLYWVTLVRRGSAA